MVAPAMDRLTLPFVIDNEDGSSNGEFNSPGFNSPGFNNAGFNNAGFNNAGFNNAGFNNAGFNNAGFNNAGFNNAGFNNAGSNNSGNGILNRIARDRDTIRQRMVEHGAVLFRGFNVGGVDGFDAVVRALSGTPLVYTERSSPRSTIKGQVYTSTDYPPSEEIFLHNECSYQTSWPLHLYFHCLQPPATLGATPLADIRRVFALIDPAVVAEFRARKWMIVRNFNGMFGVSWQQVFNTENPAEVESYCASHGLTCEWLPNGTLRTRGVRDAVHRHPVTGAEVWFNHATFFHIGTLSADVRDGLLGLFAEEDLPSNTYFGDGGRIPDDVMDHLRSCYRAATVRFPWQFDDILVVDNMTAAHAREPYTGARKIAVAMAEPYPN